MIEAVCAISGKAMKYITISQKNNWWHSEIKNKVKIGSEMSHFYKLWEIHTLNAILWHTKIIVMLLRSFWNLICMICGILCHITPEYVFLPESRTPKTQIRWFLKIWQEPGLGTKLKICVKGYRTIIKHNIEGTFHGRIQPISWRTISGVLDLLLSKHEVFPKHNVLKRAQFI